MANTHIKSFETVPVPPELLVELWVRRCVFGAGVGLGLIIAYNFELSEYVLGEGVVGHDL